MLGPIRAGCRRLKRVWIATYLLDFFQKCGIAKGALNFMLNGRDTVCSHTFYSKTKSPNASIAPLKNYEKRLVIHHNALYNLNGRNGIGRTLYAFPLSSSVGFAGSS